VNRVVWRNKALDELADIWVQTPAAGRPAVEAAVKLWSGTIFHLFTALLLSSNRQGSPK
jgi:hypothetical protein